MSPGPVGHDGEVSPPPVWPWYLLTILALLALGVLELTGALEALRP